MPVFPFLLVRERSLVQGDTDQVFLGILHRLGDGCGNFLGLPKAMAYNTVFVSYHHNGRESEGTATLGYLGYPLHTYQAVLQLKASRFYEFHILVIPVHSFY